MVRNQDCGTLETISIWFRIHTQFMVVAVRSTTFEFDIFITSNFTTPFEIKFRTCRQESTDNPICLAQSLWVYTPDSDLSNAMCSLHVKHITSSAICIVEPCFGSFSKIMFVHSTLMLEALEYTCSWCFVSDQIWWHSWQIHSCGEPFRTPGVQKLSDFASIIKSKTHSTAANKNYIRENSLPG